MSDQGREMAHLRGLPRCAVCGAPATKQLYNGWNAPYAVYCGRHAKAALAQFKGR